MKILTAFIAMSVFSFNAISDELPSDSGLYTADYETVSQIQEYCSEQYIEDPEVSIEKQILACINNDLEAAGYEVFKSYGQVKSLLKSTQEAL